jgi:hypothetical protein
MRCTLLYVTLLAPIAFALAQQPESGAPEGYAYSGAVIDTISREGHTLVEIFPFRGGAFTIPIHSASPPFAFGPDGKSLYGECSVSPPRAAGPTGAVLCQTDLSTGLVSQLTESIGLYCLEIAISPRADFILASGLLRREGDERGLFEVSVPGGEIKPIFLQHEPLEHNIAWTDLSIAPNGYRAVANLGGQLKIIDLAAHKTQPLNAKFFLATWSPDGKWLAVLEKGESGRTILLDATTLQQRRVLGHTELEWSPDSRYLLAIRSCGQNSGTLEVVDVQTDRRTSIESSACRVVQGHTGWVRRNLTR